MSLASLEAARQALAGRDAHRRGRRLTTTNLIRLSVNCGGVPLEVCPRLPEDLAEESGSPLEVYSLARLLASEGYGGSADGVTAAMVAMGQAVVNQARRKTGGDVTRLLTNSTIEAAKGKYGRQCSRYAATSQDPYDWHALVAQEVIYGDLPDLARGATKFLDPHVQQAGTQAGARLRSLEEVLTRWSPDSAWVGEIPPIETEHLAFFRPASDGTDSMQALLARLGGGAVPAAGGGVLLAVVGIAAWIALG